MNFPQRAKKASVRTPSLCLLGLTVNGSRRSVVAGDANDRRRSLTSIPADNNSFESRALSGRREAAGRNTHTEKGYAARRETWGRRGTPSVGAIHSQRFRAKPAQGLDSSTSRTFKKLAFAGLLAR